MIYLTPTDLADLRLEADKGGGDDGAKLHVLIDAYEDLARFLDANDCESVAEVQELLDTEQVCIECER